MPRFPDAKGSLTPSPWRRSEIFDIVSALETAEGKGTTFYSFLNTTKSADEKAIAKAYRKRSLELQRVPLSLSLSLRRPIARLISTVHTQPGQEPGRQKDSGPLCPPRRHRQHPQGLGEAQAVSPPFLPFGLSTLSS